MNSRRSQLKRSFARCCPAYGLTERAHFDGREWRRMTYGELFQLRYRESLAEVHRGAWGNGYVSFFNLRSDSHG